MAELLRNGFTMLNLSCPICNNPIFKNKAQKLFCPVCNREVLIVDQPIKKNESNKASSNSKVAIEGIAQDDLSNFKVESINEVIIKKLAWLTKAIAEETQLDQIEMKNKIIQELLDTLEKLKSINVQQ
ncbi:MAG: Sjogren's syndrome/scleroderma autoantigen 1 family protein [Candidatus Thorarchaeota archaeon]